MPVRGESFSNGISLFVFGTAFVARVFLLILFVIYSSHFKK